jgi:hypothetical protein
MLRYEAGAREVVLNEPDSKIAVKDNIETIYQTLLAVSRSHHPAIPIVALGHSKGGLELLLVVLRHPDLLKLGIVDRIVTIDAPLHGTPFADLAKYWADTGPYSWETDKPFYQSIPLLEIDKIKSELMNQAATEGFKSLATTEVNPMIEDAIAAQTPDQLALLRSKLFFVTSVMENQSELATGTAKLWKGLQLVFGAVHQTPEYKKFSTWPEWLAEGMGPNDGMVPVSSQSIDGLGIVIGPGEGYHSWDVKVESNENQEEGQAKVRKFTLDLFRTLF